MVKTPDDEAAEEEYIEYQKCLYDQKLDQYTEKITLIVDHIGSVSNRQISLQ